MATIEITASNGTKPYTYYVIPETQWMSGDMMHDMLLQNDISVLYRYAYETNIIPVTAGDQGNPKTYWVVVQHAAEHGTLSGTNLLAWWKMVKVWCNGPFGQ